MGANRRLEAQREANAQAISERDRAITEANDRANRDRELARRAQEDLIAANQRCRDLENARDEANAEVQNGLTVLRREQDANQRLHAEVTQLRNIGEREEKTDHLSTINERLESDLRNVRAQNAEMQQ